MKKISNPCPLGPRHKWEHRGDHQVRTQTSQAIRLSLKGVYHCACGAKKFGTPRGAL